MGKQMDVNPFKHLLRVSTGMQLLALGCLLTAAIIFTSGLGYVSISFYHVFKIIWAEVFHHPSLVEKMDQLWPVVIMDIRLPRILTAAAVGGGLAVSGVVFQGILPAWGPLYFGVLCRCCFWGVVSDIVEHQPCGHLFSAGFCVCRCCRHPVFCGVFIFLQRGIVIQ